MILVGIDVAKDKHDCCIINSDGKFPEEVFSILNTVRVMRLFISGFAH
mgnify:CR=1 FL=1